MDTDFFYSGVLNTVERPFRMTCASIRVHVCSHVLPGPSANTVTSCVLLSYEILKRTRCPCSLIISVSYVESIVADAK